MENKQFSLNEIMNKFFLSIKIQTFFHLNELYLIEFFLN